MKADKMSAAVSRLSLDEQDLLRRLGAATGEDGVAVAMDMDIRHGLTSALGEMGNAVQLLLLLFKRHAVTLPESALPAYDSLLQNISAAASDGAAWVNRSHELDQSAFLALTPNPCAYLQ